MKIKITKNNEVLKYDVVLRRENINVGVVKDKENDKCIKKIIYTVVNDQGIDLMRELMLLTNYMKSIEIVKMRI